jgi:hypothetical protein
MPIVTSPVFNQQVFATAGRRQTDRTAAVQGFSQVFASMLSAELRRSAAGSDSGLMGTSGASGDIYGAFFDQAISKVLARSPAMKPLNDMVSRELGGARDGKSANGVDSSKPVPRSEANRPAVEPVSYPMPEPAGVSEGAAAADAHGAASADRRGPLLLPPRPAIFAPVLPPPTTLTEG